MEFGILGPLRVVDAGQEMTVPPALRTLLATLLVYRSHVVSVGRLADELWGDHRGERSLDTVRAHVRNLRDLLGAKRNDSRRSGFDLITVRGVGYRLEVPHGKVDADRFVELCRQGMELVVRRNHTRASAILTEALKLWRGPPLPELSDRPAAIDLVSRLELTRRRARTAWVEAELALGRDRHVVDELEQLVTECPTHGQLRYWWALATYRTSGAEQAAQVCQAGIAHLAGYGVDVDELRDLQQRILRHDPSLAPKVYPHPEPIFQVERGSSPTFIGRMDQLVEVDSLLAERRGLSAPGAVAIHGLGGVGKSRLAIEYCYLHAHEYDVVCWIPANDEASITSRLSGLGRRLGVSGSMPKEVVLAQVWEALRGRTRWLLVYDDAISPADLEPYWPRTSNGHVLVTSRNPAWGGWAAPYLLRPLAFDDAVDFFVRYGPDDDGAAAKDLARALGSLPLAMELARAYMEETKTSVRDYLRRLREHAAAVLGVARTDSSQSVARTWLVALESLRAQAIEAEQLLSLFAFLGPVAFPRSTLNIQHEQMPEPLRTALADPLSHDRIVAALGRYSLASVHPESIEVHVLLQTVIRLFLPADEQARWHRAAIRLVVAGLPENTRDSTARPTLAVLYPHALAVIGHHGADDLEPMRTARLATASARYARALSDLRKAVDLYRRALGLLDGMGLGNGADAADMLLELGLAYRELGDFDEAAAAIVRACQVSEELFGQRSAEFSIALTMAGLVTFDRGDMPAALATLDTAAAIQESLPHVAGDMLATTSSARGLALWRMYELDDARTALSRAVTLREEIYGPEHPDVATALDNLGKVLLDQGDLDQALSLNARALRIRETKLGPTHLHTAVGRNHLGYVLRELGRFAEALASHECAFTTLESLYGPTHSHVGRSLDGIGLVLLRQHRYPEAADKLRTAHAVFAESLGPEHYETAVCLGNLAQALWGSGDVGGGRKMTEHALRLLADSKAYPPDHPAINRLRTQLDGIPPA
jgi:tetratricopeptide (TPR) repeat protein/DNA-binding SARP family transcriptional activator